MRKRKVAFLIREVPDGYEDREGHNIKLAHVVGNMATCLPLIDRDELLLLRKSIDTFLRNH